MDFRINTGNIGEKFATLNDIESTLASCIKGTRHEQNVLIV